MAPLPASHASHQLIATLAGWLRPEQAPQIMGGEDLAAMLDLARSTKTIGLVPGGAAAIGLNIPPELHWQIEAVQSQILRQNLQIFACAARLAAILDAAGICYFVAKGPLRAEQIYGAADVRASQDLDLYVGKEDYRAVSALLESEMGYRCLVGADDRWWHDFLGESPFQPREGIGPTIDLHNQLQQPGGPHPAHSERFFEHRVARPLGRSTAYILAPDDALMLTAISFGKALRGGEPWLSYAHELMFALKNGPPTAEAELGRRAKEFQINRLFEEFVRCAKTLFAQPSPSAAEALSVERESIVMSACGLKSLGLFGRTRASWRWAEGTGLKRLRQFGFALNQEGLSRVARKHSVMIEPAQS